MADKAGPGPSFILLGADSILTSLRAMAEEIEGVKRAEDIECVHRMRVASRRLRARLRVFKPLLPAHRAAKWAKDVRRLTRALGEARDTDVQLEFLATFKAGIDNRRERDGITRLELRLSQHRQREQTKVLKALQRMSAKSVLDEMGRVLSEKRIAAQMEPGADRPSADSLGRARAAVAARIMEFLSFGVFIPDRARVRELHQMRIAAKRLRYTMEIFEPWFPESLPKEIRQIKAVQEVLGDIHDADVWTVFLPDFLERERSRATEFYGKPRGVSRLRPGLDLLARDRADFRERRWVEFLQGWEKLKNSRRWRSLMKEMFPRAGIPAAEDNPPMDEAHQGDEPLPGPETPGEEK